MSKQYRVEVERQIVQRTTVEVNAANPSDAVERACALARSGLAWTNHGVVLGPAPSGASDAVMDITPPPVDRSARELLSGKKEAEQPDYRENRGDGQQKDYVVLSAEERAKGFVRPVRRSYRHLTCKGVTTMGYALAETYARDPGFYSGTFCVNCGAHFPLDQFVWEGTEEKLGS